MELQHLHNGQLKLGLNECTWCVQNARCHHRDDNYGICGDSAGWWGDQGTEIRQPDMCTRNDRRPGLTYIKYNYPVNYTMPDYVSIVNATMVDFSSPPPAAYFEQRQEGEMLARLLGFVRPQQQWNNNNNSAIQVCSSYSSAVLRAGLGMNLDALENVTSQSSNQSYCSNVQLPSTEQPFLIDFQVSWLGNFVIYNFLIHITNISAIDIIIISCSCYAILILFLKVSISRIVKQKMCFKCAT